MSERGRFTALEGIDGCGKTTVARTVADQDYESLDLTNGRIDEIVFVSRRSIGRTDEFSTNLMRQNANMLWHSGDSTTLSPSFWVTLQASWFTALTDTVIRPLVEGGRSVVVDGWYYKFWSKLLNQGYSIATLTTIFEGSMRPDHVVLLDPDVGATYDRGRDFRPSELGMHAGFTELSRSTYIQYQSQGLRHLKDFAKRWSWDIVGVGDDEHPQQTAHSARELLRLRGENK